MKKDVMRVHCKLDLPQTIVIFSIYSNLNLKLNNPYHINRLNHILNTHNLTDAVSKLQIVLISYQKHVIGLK